MTDALQRIEVFPEKVLPDAEALIAEARETARTVTVQPSPFLSTYEVGCEIDYKRRCTADQRVMMHAQIGFRDLDKSRRAWAEIWEALDKAGHRVDRYGICLDWSMGYPAARRKDMPRGTGLIMKDLDDWRALTGMAPVAPHFGDFVIGTPAAFENTIAALLSGSTSIGNLGQYFAFRQPHWDDEIFTTAESLKAIALTAAQPVPIIVHSSLDDGFASMFTDLACSLGAILLEQYIVDDLLGGHSSYSYGNTYARPDLRLAFQRAAQKVTRTPGTMIYGATTMYGPNHAENYAALATYLRIDIYGERTRPAGHAVNPTPVTEAERIPDIDEIIDVHMFANRLVALDDARRGRAGRCRGCACRPDRRRRPAVPRQRADRVRGGRNRHHQSLRDAARHSSGRSASRPCSGRASRRRGACAAAFRSPARFRSSSSSMMAKGWSTGWHARSVTGSRAPG
jgi:hypothetical protein